ncbi:MAG: MogA/MoaB family molybdenum cofactor biosynthesis protein [Thermoanaerobaculia bacterium]
MSVEEHRADASGERRRDFAFGLLIVSDSRTDKTDQGGPLMRTLVTGAGHRVVAQSRVRDEVDAVREAVLGFLAMPETEVVLLSGGTGFSPRDVTVEAVRPLFEREIVGFGELFRMLSFEVVGAAAMLSRATAGFVGTRAIFLLPGAPAAIELALTRLVLPEIRHLLGQARRPAVSERRST